MASLNKDPRMIKVMEDDLRTKIQNMINSNPELGMVVHGVFSVDELEQKMESELGGSIAVGVQYNGITRVTPDDATTNAGRGDVVKMLNFGYSVILGVPVGEFGDRRDDATYLLTLLRFAILGKPIGDDRIQRTWDFVFERPEVGASSTTMLYYAQVWQVAMQNHGSAI